MAEDRSQERFLLHVLTKHGAAHTQHLGTRSSSDPPSTAGSRALPQLARYPARRHRFHLGSSAGSSVITHDEIKIGI